MNQEIHSTLSSKEDGEWESKFKFHKEMEQSCEDSLSVRRCSGRQARDNLGKASEGEARAYGAGRTGGGFQAP